MPKKPIIKIVNHVLLFLFVRKEALKSGEIIKELRKEKGWSQQQLADELKITQHAISQWETRNRTIDLITFQQVLELLDASLTITQSNFNSAAYYLEPSTYIGSGLVITIEPSDSSSHELEVYRVLLERSGLKLILPEFIFGEGYHSLSQQQEMVLKHLAFDYALYEDCPTLADYLSNRGIEVATEADINDFNQLKHDIECCSKFFDETELAVIDC